MEADIPVLMLTARDMEVGEIMGLKSGADDHITKPFSISVLKIRLENALRKHQANTKAETDQEKTREKSQSLLRRIGIGIEHDGIPVVTILSGA